MGGIVWPGQPHAVCNDGTGGMGQLSLGGNDDSEVDGLSTATVDHWFAEADHDGDGRLAGDEAKAFFRRTQLPVQALSKVCAVPDSEQQGKACPMQTCVCLPFRFCRSTQCSEFQHMSVSLLDAGGRSAWRCVL
jgi:hypothetical protein